MSLEKILKEQGIEEDKITSILESITKNKIYISKKSDEEYGALESKVKGLEDSLKNANKTINDMKKDGLTIEELNKKIESYEKEKSERELNDALDNVLKEHNIKDLKLFKRTLNMDNISFNDGKLTGLIEQVNELKKDAPYLFNNENNKDTGGLPGGKKQDESLEIGKIIAKQNQNNESSSLSKFFN